MASLTFDSVTKVYPDGTEAVSDLNLEIADQEFAVFVGPSGCGKTTALRMVAGLEDITGGEIRIDGTPVNQVEPRKRDVAMVFQNYALYPHMTVFANIAFPLQAQRVPKAEVRARVERAASLLGLTDHLNRRPRHLSGGQRQRVAMGRAIVRQPKLFLMDEPLSNLDAKLRVQMRADVARLQRELGVTTIYVTHDQVEAMTMGSRIVVMRKGVLQQSGPPQQLYDEPVNLFVATFIGSPAMNLFQAQIANENGGLTAVVGEQQLALANPPAALAGFTGRSVAVGVRPEHLPHASSKNTDLPRLQADVALVEALGSEKLVHVELTAEPVMTDEILEIARDTDASIAGMLRAEAQSGIAPVIARFDSRSKVERGEQTEIAVDVDELHFFDLETGQAIR